MCDRILQYLGLDSISVCKCAEVYVFCIIYLCKQTTHPSLTYLSYKWLYFSFYRLSIVSG